MPKSKAETGPDPDPNENQISYSCRGLICHYAWRGGVEARNGAVGRLQTSHRRFASLYDEKRDPDPHQSEKSDLYPECPN